MPVSGVRIEKLVGGKLSDSIENAGSVYVIVRIRIVESAATIRPNLLPGFILWSNRPVAPREIQPEPWRKPPSLANAPAVWKLGRVSKPDINCLYDDEAKQVHRCLIRS